MGNKKCRKTNNRVALLRMECGLSQKELGDMLYIDQHTISNIENGSCTLSNIILIADFFGVSLDYILNRSNEKGNVLQDLGEVDLLVLEQLKAFSKAEKERLLKHLELENSLKSANDN